MSSREQDMNKFTPYGPQYSVAETYVAVIYKHLSNTPYSFRHCDLLVLNKSHQKKPQVKNNAFTDCHTEDFIRKLISCAYFLFIRKVPK